jgi:integrase
LVHRVKGSQRYYASVAIHGRRTLRVSAYPQRKPSEQLERALEELAALRAQGEKPGLDLQRFVDGLPDRVLRRLVKLDLLDAEVGDADTRSLAAILGSGKCGSSPGQFEVYLGAKGNTAGHARQQAARTRRVLVEQCRFKTISEIKAEPVLLALADLRAEGMGGTTSNAFRQACRSMTRWLARQGRLPADPLAHLERVKAESKSDRRALTAEEQAKLVAVTRTQPCREGLTGEARSVLYLIALSTGLRRTELLTLKRSNLSLDGEVPTITVEHGHAKNRKTARIPMAPETAAVLRAFVADALPAALVFRGVRKDYHAAAVLRHDLKVAGIQERTGEGRVDFHAMRVSFITNMARVGVPLAQAQKLARHCSPVLTANIYSRFGFDEDAAAIAKLPNLAEAVG